MSLKLGPCGNKDKLCCSTCRKDLPSYSHNDNNLKNELLDSLLQPHLSQAPLERERIFKQIFSSILERCREQIARSRAYRIRFKLGHYLEVGQKLLNGNHKQYLTRKQKLRQRNLGPFAITKRITNTTYQIQEYKVPATTKTVPRNHLVENYPKERSLPAMIEKYLTPDLQKDNFYERFMEQRARDLNNPTTTDEHDSFPFPIEPLQSTSSKDQGKRLDTHSSDSGVNSPLASFQSTALLHATPIETSSPRSSTSQQAHFAQPLPTAGTFSPIQHFIRNSAKLRPKEPKHNH